jgi:hypothetical protein
MSNVLEFNAVDEAERVLQLDIEKYQNEIETLDREVKDLTTNKIDLAVASSNCTNTKEKKEIDAERKKVDAKIKQLKNAIENNQGLLESAELDLAVLRKQKSVAVVQKTSENTAKKVFDEHNIHYVIFDQQWWSVDPAGDRMSVKINSSESSVIKDLIYNDSNWEIKDEQELKRLAKGMGRMYKHIVRDFNPAHRPSIYNQMDDIRKQWLKPISGVMPHDAFRILTLSIAGGRDDYADQLEKYIAYRYCHPEDVMIPNIDSCAIGGTGRDTYYSLIRRIFTNECCGSAGAETFKGTHNGDLFGKMFVVVDEKNSNVVPIDVIKELTGKETYRDRRMNKDGRDAVRLFNFIFFRNGYTTTARLSGTGSLGEDRRWEPIIARVNLPRHIAHHFGLIPNIDTPLTPEQTQAMSVIIKDWQRDYYKNEERIAEWLGHIISKHNVTAMTEFIPLHGVYYEEMLLRQQRGLDGFMPRFLALAKDTNVLRLKDIWKIYEASETIKISKDGFKNQLLYWLNSKAGWDAELTTGQVYTHANAGVNERHVCAYIYNKLDTPTKIVFDLEEFIDKDAVDDKGTTVGLKISPFSLREELR